MEADAVTRVTAPATPSTLLADLRDLGVKAGMTLIVHSSMSQLGWVAGGPQAVVQALLEAVGKDGTLMMPTFSTNLSDPTYWQDPPVPESWWPIIKAETPAFDPALTPTRQMGAIVECFRHVPGVRRSSHPAVSFAAVGPRAAELVGHHGLGDGLGDESPLARSYDADGFVLLLGVSHWNNTSLHLAEYRARYAGKRYDQSGAPMLVDGVRQWVTFRELDKNTDDFEKVGAAFAAEIGYREGPVGAGIGRLMLQRALVDFAVSWFEEHRVGEASR